MRSITENRSLARVAGVLGVVGHLAASIFYLVLPGLVVTFPTLYAFWLAWAIVLGASIWWLRSHPWRSFGIPLLGLGLDAGAIYLGERFLGWTG